MQAKVHLAGTVERFTLRIKDLLTGEVLDVAPYAGIVDYDYTFRRPSEALPFEPSSHDMNSALSHRPSKPPPAMRRIRSKRACLAGCCARAT